MNAGDWKTRLRYWLDDGELARVVPEVWALRGVQQPPEYHPEGDAYTHTMLAVDAVEETDNPRVFWAVLLHDTGKAHTTRFEHGRWRSHGHADVSATLVLPVMERFGCLHLADDVSWLVKNHHYEHSWNLEPGAPLSPRQRRFTGHALFGLLQRVCRADALGRLKRAG